jgi:hypothetical protein
MTMSVLAYATNLVLLLLVVVAGVLSVLKRTSGPLTVAACLASVTCLAVSHLLLQPQKLDAMFLRQFASRVDNEVGFAALQTFASSVRADVETGRRTGAPINRSDLPKSIRQLFPGTGLHGYANFNGTNFYDVQIEWGGALFSWGVEVFGDVPKDYVHAQKRLIRPLSTNAIVFIRQ